MSSRASRGTQPVSILIAPCMLCRMTYAALGSEWLGAAVLDGIRSHPTDSRPGFEAISA